MPFSLLDRQYQPLGGPGRLYDGLFYQTSYTSLKDVFFIDKQRKKRITYLSYSVNIVARPSGRF
jgi:hypothetical protein